MFQKIMEEGQLVVKSKTSNFKIKLCFNSPKILGLQYLILSFFWLILIILLVGTVVLFSLEKSNVNIKENVDAILDQISNSDSQAEKTELYKKLIDIKYPLIDFSLMNFIGFISSGSAISDWPNAWAQKVNNINIAYSYIFITALIAIIGFIFYIIIIVKIYKRARFEKKYNLKIKYHNDYVIYDTRIYLNFTVNLAIVFSFFNFLSTLVTLIYGIILILISYFFWYVLKIKSELLIKHKWWTTPNFSLFTAILLIQNSFSILKVVFANEFGVNLDLILSVLFPIGTITVMITLLIRNMMNTQVSAIKNAIKAINARLSSFRIFYYSQEEDSLQDYTFVTQLPVLIKNPLEKDAITTKEAYKLMTIVNETAKFFEEYFEKEKERKYMLYHLFNEITDLEEIKEIKDNVLKVKNEKSKKNK